jgi:lipid-A-disaccharide synthase-like uncharacterized protein
VIIDLGPWHLVVRTWDIVGFVGQGLFFSRFVVQWLASERAGKSYIPSVFWWLSIIGGLISLVYAIGINNAPYTLGQSVGLVPYARNLMLLQRQKKRAAEPVPPLTPD